MLTFEEIGMDIETHAYREEWVLSDGFHRVKRVATETSVFWLESVEHDEPKLKGIPFWRVLGEDAAREWEEFFKKNLTPIGDLNMIKLGSRCADVISGFEGIAIARAQYLYGCVQVCLAPEELDKDEKPREAVWFDEQRLHVLEEAVGVSSGGADDGPGGPQITPPDARGVIPPL